ncbi:hypothetical protein TL16_g00290 [Triparma laevis f. inornata]|uniref:Uncharacterized protein n=2 Tax=Triparma laevis TaxID=1534972 RepID=A0A9W7FG80_9STRA|nr:hypothetical protein TL16_g00290 [Triparma laevis f. inornata]GMI11592.1 hypothetical protein TrLO_g12249 [Triparma laevis f. longispina]
MSMLEALSAFQKKTGGNLKSASGNRRVSVKPKSSGGGGMMQEFQAKLKSLAKTKKDHSKALGRRRSTLVNGGQSTLQEFQAKLQSLQPADISGGTSETSSPVGRKSLSSQPDVIEEGDEDDSDSENSYSGHEESDFFYSIRANNIEIVKDALQKHPSLIEVEFGVHQAYDTQNIMPQVKSKRIYMYNGDPDKEGFCNAMHVASEAGCKDIVLLLHGIDGELYDSEDYREKIPGEIANGEAADAFKEIDGKTFEGHEQFEGEFDEEGRKHVGKVWKKLDGYEEDEYVFYEGHFKDDAYHGKGTLYFPGTEVMQYDGDFADGLFDGHGVLFFEPQKPDGTIDRDASDRRKKEHIGAFKDGMKHGHGVEYHREPPDGTSKETIWFEGSFKNNKRSGYGKETYSDGIYYEGHFEEGMKQGAGTYYNVDGRYEGMFESDHRQGKGSFYKKDGSRIDCEWDNDQRVKGTECSNNKFVADPIDLFGTDDPDFLHNKEFGGIADSTLFDRDMTEDAFIVRMALVFLDGFAQIMDKKRFNDCEGPRGDKILELLQEVCARAKEEVIVNGRESARRGARANILQRDSDASSVTGGGRGEESDTFIYQDGLVAEKLIMDILQFSDNGRNRMAKRLAVSLMKARLNFS